MVPIAPRQRAIFFDPGDHHGETVGHHCTIVEVDPVSQQNHPYEPNAWRVFAYFAHLKLFKEVDARDLIALAERDESELPLRPPSQLELQFVADGDDEDREQIHGKYRKGRWYWQNFVFTKVDQPLPTWQLRGPVRGNQVDLGEVIYSVPLTERLNGRYVQQAMKEIFARGDGHPA